MYTMSLTTSNQANIKDFKKGSLEESCESLIVGTADGREERYNANELRLEIA